jgi:L-rhamnose-H+ transport protein
MTTIIVIGIFLAILSGIMNGLFTLPMRYLGRWEWENVWSLFVVVSCILLPAAVVVWTVPGAMHLLVIGPRQAEAAAIVCGFLWGFGSIMFGQCVSALGISLANTVVLAVSASLGSLLPLLLLDPSKAATASGRFLFAGTGVAVVGIVLCGRAGWLREHESVGKGFQEERTMVGHARPLWVGVLLAGGAGIFSAVSNIGYTLAQPLVTTVRDAGLSALAGANLIWWLILGSGAISNLAFCIYLFRKNGSFYKFSNPGKARLYPLAALMGVLWGGSIFVYGTSATQLGKIGPAIGWPLSLTVGLIVANIAGILSGEWRNASFAANHWMRSGLGVLLVSIFLLSLAAR